MLSKITDRLGHLPRDSRDTLLLLLVIAWVLLPQTPHLPLWCSALAGTVLLWRGWLAVGNKPLPAKWLLWSLLGLTIGATLFTHQTLLGRDAGVTLLVVLLSLKTLELRARRDAFVVFFLSFFCMLSHFFYSQSLLTAANMLLGLLGLLTILVNAHMLVGKPPLMQAVKTASWLTLLGAPVMLAMFVLFPRLAPLWGVPGDAMTGRSGLSQNMQVGTIARLALDESVAMRLKFEDRLPAQKDMYFRGPVLSDFDGREWRQQPLNNELQGGAVDKLVVSGTPLNYEVTLEPTSQPWLFVMEAAVQSPVLAGYQSMMQADLQWRVNRPITDLVRYKAQSYTTFSHGPTESVVGLREFVELPPGFNPRTLALANQIRSEARYAAAGSAPLVELVLERLRTGGFTYTLDPGVYGKNTADEFWFDRKEGFCEHIASSFVILMRALDVPARIVTGYQGGEQNPIDGFWLIRQSDAHAWAEVWYEGRGWVRVDPTGAVSPNRTGASQRLLAPQGVVAQVFSNFSPDAVARFRATWEAINNSWNQSVLNYTQGRQFDLLKNIGFESPGWEDLGYMLIGLVVLSSLISAAFMMWGRTHQHDPWLRLLDKAKQKLRKTGVESTPATSPRQLAQLVQKKFGSQDVDKIQALHDWLMQLEMMRYSSPSNNQTSPISPTLHTSHSRSTPNTRSQRQVLQQLKQQFNALNWPD